MELFYSHLEFPLGAFTKIFANCNNLFSVPLFLSVSEMLYKRVVILYASDKSVLL